MRIHPSDRRGLAVLATVLFVPFAHAGTIIGHVLLLPWLLDQLNVMIGLMLVSLILLALAFLFNRAAVERKVRNRTAKIQAANENMREIVKALPLAMLVVDREARVLDANPSASKLFRADVRNCLNKGCGDFLRCVNRHLDPRGCGFTAKSCAACALRNAIRSVYDGGPEVEAFDMELLVDGGAKPEAIRIRFSAAPVVFNNQRQVVVALDDITDWHRTERLYQTLFTEMHYGLVLLERIVGDDAHPVDFGFQTANPAFEKLTGTPADSVRDQTLCSAIKDLPPDLIRQFDHVVRTGEASRLSFYLPSLRKHFEGTAFRPGTNQLAMVFTDVSDRKHAEEKARAAAEETARLLNETRLAQQDLVAAVEEQKRADEALIHERNLLYALMDNLPDRIYFKDIDSRFLKISKAYAHTLGLSSPNDAIGKTNADFKPDAAEILNEQEQEILASGQPLLGQVEQEWTLDGRTRWVSTSKAPIKNQNGCVVGLVGISRDITHEIEMQQQLQQASKMDAIGRLAGGVAHDFNNLLQAILGFTEILIGDLDDKSPQYDDLKQIERAARRAEELTRQLLTFSRKQRTEPHVLDLNQAIISTERMLHRLLGEDIKIVHFLTQEAQTICADPNQIEQIIINLAVNSRDAMPSGGRLTFTTETVDLYSVDTAMIPESHTGRFVCMTVSDTGSGIKPEVLSHLFEPFFTTKGLGKGTGLGLSVIYGIVKQNDGWINVYSQLGQGTTFKVYLPAHKEATTGTPSPTLLAPEPGSRTESADNVGTGKRILLVEDEIGVRSLATRVLRSAGFNVTACEDAQTAQTLFTRTPNEYDMLFSDVVLPGRNGIELAIELRKNRPNLPILLCSGYADDRVRWAAIKQEGFHFITKPYPKTSLLRAIAETLRDR